MIKESMSLVSWLLPGGGTHHIWFGQGCAAQVTKPLPICKHRRRNNFQSEGPDFLKSKMAPQRPPSHLRDAGGGGV